MANNTMGLVFLDLYEADGGTVVVYGVDLTLLTADLNRQCENQTLCDSWIRFVGHLVLTCFPY